MPPTRRRHHSTDDRAQQWAETQALIAAARAEMNDPQSPILARLASNDPDIGAEVHGYSLRNQVLLVHQAITRGLSLREVATFPQWRERGRVVRSGQRSLRVIGYRDIPETDEDASTDLPGRAARPNPTRTVAVFSVDQTEVDGERPAPQRLRQGLAARLRDAGYAVVDDPAQNEPIRIDHAARTVRVRTGDLCADTLRGMSAALTALVKPIPQ